MGSMHEIGFMEGSINENTPCHPVTPYGISKNMLRELTEMLYKQNDVMFQWLSAITYLVIVNTVPPSSPRSLRRKWKGKLNSRSRWDRISSISSIMRTSANRWLVLLGRMRSSVLSTSPQVIPRNWLIELNGL